MMLLIFHIVFAIILIVGLYRLIKWKQKTTRLNQHLDEIIEAAPFAMILISPDGSIVRANTKAEKILGLRRDSITKRAYSSEGWKNTDLNGKPLSGTDLPVGMALSTGKPVYDFKHYTVKPDGIKILLTVSAIPMINGTGSAYVLATFEDITDKERLRISLESSERRYRNLFENLTQGFALHRIILDDTGKAIDYEYIAINPAFTKLTGIPAAKIIGKTLKQLMPESEDYWIQTFGKVALTGEPIRYENFAKELGKTYDTFAFCPELGQFAVVFSDISDQKNLLKQVEMKSEEMARFTYMVSHDLKTPLITIQSFANYLEKDIIANDSDAIHKDLDYILKASGRMALLLDDVLQFSRIGRVCAPSQDFTLQEIFSEVQTMLAGRLTRKHIELALKSNPVMIHGERNRISEVFQNLIENAVKFTNQQDHPFIEVSTEPMNDSVLFIVRDNGIGIEPRFHDRIFGLFDKLDPQSEGTGLGLALVKKIIEVHGGKIWIESEGVGKGCTFKFHLANARFL